MVAKLPNEPLVTVRIWLLRIRFKLALTYLLSRGRLYTFTPYLTKSLVRKGWVEDMEFSLIPSEFIQFWSQSNRWIRFEVREVLNLSFSRASIPFITISFLNGKLKIFDISSKRTNKMWSEMCPIFIAVESASLRRVILKTCFAAEKLNDDQVKLVFLMETLITSLILLKLRPGR